jgi:L-fucose mutarotase/ribose pyranase (RbsD/FucU family)
VEKQGATNQSDIRELVKKADAEAKVVVVNMDGFKKYASTKRHKEAVVIVATGERAVKLRDIFKDLLT